VQHFDALQKATLRRTATAIKRETERFGYVGFVVMRLMMNAVSATPVSRALWFIESHLAHDLKLNQLGSQRRDM
jgi:hypothetical protein